MLESHQQLGLKVSDWYTTSPVNRRLSWPPAVFCAKLASRLQKMQLSYELAEKNIRLSHRENCDVDTEKLINTVFSIFKLFAKACFAIPCQRCYVLIVFMYKTFLP